MSWEAWAVCGVVVGMSLLAGVLYLITWIQGLMVKGRNK